MKSIGIKLADGSFYPVLEEGSAEKKVLELTTVQDNQTTVQIDLYRSGSGSIDDAEYVDTLEIRNMKPHPNGEPNLKLDISLDENNQLKAEVKDPETGKVSETQVRLVSRTLAERNEPVNFNIDDVTNAEENISNESAQDDDVFANTIANDLPANDTEENDMIGTAPNDEDFSFDSLNSDLDSVLEDDNIPKETDTVSPEEIEEDILQEPADTSTDDFDFGDVAVGAAAGLAAGAAVGYAMGQDESSAEVPEEKDALTPEDSLSDFNLEDFAPSDGNSADLSEIEESLNLNSTEDPFSEKETIDVPTGDDFEAQVSEDLSNLDSEGIADSTVDEDLSLPDIPEEDILATESILDDLDSDSSLDEDTVKDIEENSIVEDSEESSEDLSFDINEEVSNDADAPEVPSTDFSVDPETSAEDFSTSEIDSDIAPVAEDTPEEATDFELPDFGEETSDEASEEISFDLPEEEPAETTDESSFELPTDEVESEPSTETEESADFELPDFGEETADSSLDSFIEEPVSEDSSFDLSDSLASEEVPEDFSAESIPEDFSETSITDTETSATEDEFPQVPDTEESVPEDSLDLPDFGNEAENEVSFASEETPDFDLPDFGDVDLSGTEPSADEFIKKDNTFVPENSMFNDLYDKETIEGKTAENIQEERKEGSKTKVHVIICTICAVICIAAALLVLFVIPSKINISQKIDKNQTPAADVAPEEPVAAIETPAPEVSIEVKREPLPDPIPNPTEAEPEPAAEDTSAKEDEIVTTTTPEVVVPEAPSAPETKPADIRYKIVWGDTLWDIADAYYKNPWRYKRIAKYNGIKNPDKIISGTWILIPAE